MRQALYGLTAPMIVWLAAATSRAVYGDEPCVLVVNLLRNTHTTETQRTQRLHRER
jgi:hypothetical protein